MQADLTLAPPAPARTALEKRPRVLLVSHAAEMGGAEQGLLDLARHIGPSHCDVLLFADGPLRPALERRGIAVRVLSAGRVLLGVRRGGAMARALVAVPAALELGTRLARIAGAYDLIYANSQKAAAVALLASAITRHKVIWHLHDILSADHFGWLQRHAMAFLSKHFARAVIVVSAAARDAFVASGGTQAGLHIIHNGIDPAPFKGLPDMPREDLRQALCLPAGPLVGLFGRITPWKGQRVLIEALQYLPGTHALIVGSPMFGEDAEDAYLKKRAADLGVDNRVHFLGYRADTPRLMRAVDLVVHCSTAPEPFGRVIVEALFAGTPILAADGGASREILGTETTWLVPPGNAPALAAAIARTLATDAATMAFQVAAMRSRVEEEFTLSRMMAGIDRLIAEA